MARSPAYGSRQPERGERCIRLLLAALAAATILLFVGPAVADAHHGCHTSSCVERVARKQCDRGSVTACLRRAALHHRVSYPLLRAIAWCESRLNDRAIYARPTNRQIDLGVWDSNTSTGLLQFKPSTFAGTPYMRFGKAAIFTAKINALAGGWLLRRSGTWPWTASRHCWS